MSNLRNGKYSKDGDEIQRFESPTRGSGFGANINADAMWRGIVDVLPACELDESRATGSLTGLPLALLTEVLRSNYRVIMGPDFPAFEKWVVSLMNDRLLKTTLRFA